MQRVIDLIIMAMVCCGVAGCATHSYLLGEGDITRELKNVELMQPLEGDVRYLGIAEGDYFSPVAIDADVLVLHFFSMYCPKCQADAATVNEFYDLTLKPHADLVFKIIGIGFANSEFEVAIFKRKFNVLFPLFPDIYGEAARELSVYTTPHFIVVERTDDGKFRLIYQKADSMDNPVKFLKTIFAHVAETKV